MRDAAVTNDGAENVIGWLGKNNLSSNDKLADHADTRIVDAVRKDGFVAGLHKHYNVK